MVTGDRVFTSVVLTYGSRLWPILPNHPYCHGQHFLLSTLSCVCLDLLGWYVWGAPVQFIC